jgi:hypothetical protein
MRLRDQVVEVTCRNGGHPRIGRKDADNILRLIAEWCADHRLEDAARLLRQEAR